MVLFRMCFNAFQSFSECVQWKEWRLPFSLLRWCHDWRDCNLSCMTPAGTGVTPAVGGRLPRPCAGGNGCLPAFRVAAPPGPLPDGIADSASLLCPALLSQNGGRTHMMDDAIQIPTPPPRKQRRQEVQGQALGPKSISKSPGAFPTRKRKTFNFAFNFKVESVRHSTRRS